MTKKKENSRRKEETRIIIIRKLLAGPQYATDLEKNLGDIPTLFLEEPEIGLRDLEIPHATLNGLLLELENDGSVIEVESQKKSKRRLPMKRYDLTALGLIEYFKHLRDTGGIRIKNETWTNLHRLLPWVSENWSRLTELFSTRTLIACLPDSSDIALLRSQHGSFVGSTMLNIGRINFKIYTDVYPVKNNKDQPKSHEEDVHLEMKRLITFSFINNLSREVPVIFSGSNKIETKLFSMIKSDHEGYKAYSKYFAQMEYNAIKTKEFVDRLNKKYKISNDQKKRAKLAASLFNKHLKKLKMKN